MARYEMPETVVEKAVAVLLEIAEEGTDPELRLAAASTLFHHGTERDEFATEAELDRLADQLAERIGREQPVQLALTLVNGDVLLGDEADVQRLLKFASGFGASQPGVPVTRRVTDVSGVTEAPETARWVNSTHVISISEVP